MLDKYNKNKGSFKVPENYFEDLHANVMNKLPLQEEKQVKKVQLWKKILPWTAVAAVFVAVALSVGVFEGMPSSERTQNGLENEKTNYNQQEQMAYNDVVQDYLLFLEDEAEEYEYADILFEE